ncbi:MAG TPA: GNAT family N-acetyltransferase [Vicinamibacterales bacterium]|nr:GNAT family N-acetyltransferase [Vicinamibacterales bacterium]
MKEDDDIDEALEETFPASDPPANTVETGVARGVPRPSPAEVIDDRSRSRFEVRDSGGVAFLDYTRDRGTMTIVHTEVPETLRGRGLGTALVEAALASARADALRVVVRCPFASAYLKTHPAR